MARVTVEDCIKKVQNNRFALVALSAERVRHIRAGAPITIAGFNPKKDKNKEKDTVIALRELAADNISPDILREQLIYSLRSVNNIDNIEDENMHNNVQDELDQEAKDLYDVASNDDILPENNDMLFTDDSEAEEEFSSDNVDNILSEDFDDK